METAHRNNALMHYMMDKKVYYYRLSIILSRGSYQAPHPLNETLFKEDVGNWELISTYGIVFSTFSSLRKLMVE